MQLQPISGKPNPPIRQFVVRERVLFMNDVADTFQQKLSEKTHQSRSSYITH